MIVSFCSLPELVKGAKNETPTELVKYFGSSVNADCIYDWASGVVARYVASNRRARDFTTRNVNCLSIATSDTNVD